MPLDLTSVLYGSLCCLSFYVAWSHFRFVCTSPLSDFICQMLSLEVCMGLYAVRVSMSVCQTSDLCGSLCCPRPYAGWSHFSSVRVSIFSDFLCHLVSPPFCMNLCVFRVSMSHGLTFILYGYLCYPIFYFTWPHFRSSWVSILSEFLYRLLSFPFCMYLYVARVSM